MNTILSVLPPLLAIVLALATKNILLALFSGIVLSSIIVNGWGFIAPIVDDYLVSGVSGNADILIYMIMFGIFLAAIKHAGGYAAFAEAAGERINTPKKSKVLTWFLSCIVVNQTFGSLGIGSIMRPVTDKNKVPREKLGFILSSCSEPIAAIVPITIYILFFGGMASSILETDGSALFIQSIPYNFFCILCIIYALLSALEIIPDFGPMKKAEKRAKETGALVREGSSPMTTAELDEMEVAEGVKPDILCFILPFVALIGTVIIIYIMTSMFDLGPAILIGLVVALGYPVIRGYFKFTEIPGIVFQGAKSMVPVVVILGLAFGFGQAVSAVGFAAYVVGIASNLLTAKSLPVIVFLICCICSYATGSLVSACVILSPIALTLGASVGGNLPLVMAALVGGSTFGDCSSPLSDIVIESAMGAEVDVIDLGKAQFIPRMIVVALTCILCLIFA